MGFIPNRQQTNKVDCPKHPDRVGRVADLASSPPEYTTSPKPSKAGWSVRCEYCICTACHEHGAWKLTLQKNILPVIFTGIRLIPLPEALEITCLREAHKAGRH